LRDGAGGAGVRRDAIVDHVRLDQPDILFCGTPASSGTSVLCAFLNAPDGLTRQLLHSACFGAAFVWLLADWPREAVSTFVVVLLVLAGHWAVVLLG
jgi:hypothetical protein